MIIFISILDKHRPAGEQHVGAYTFEIDYPGDSHFDFLTIACPIENEDVVRKSMPMNRLLHKSEIPDPVRVDSDGRGPGGFKANVG